MSLTQILQISARLCPNERHLSSAAREELLGGRIVVGWSCSRAAELDGSASRPAPATIMQRRRLLLANLAALDLGPAERVRPCGLEALADFRLAGRKSRPGYVSGARDT